MTGPSEKHAATGAMRARQVAPVFSASVLLDLARKGRSPLLSALARETPPKGWGKPRTYARFFDACHAELWAHHRSEYVYKNAIASKILMGRHSVRTTRFLSEFRVDACKADVVLINGTSTCYEIKTELDGLDRLSRQLDSYGNVFDLTYVVTFPGYVEQVLRSVPRHVGVLSLTEDYAFATRREATSNRHNIKPASVFDSLRRDEYTEIIRDAYGHVPAVPNTQMYRECRRLFSDLAPEAVHDAMVRVLKRRRLPAPVATLVESITPCLRSAVLASPLRGKDVAGLTAVLDSELIM
jgi:hypothetical protein